MLGFSSNDLCWNIVWRLDKMLGIFLVSNPLKIFDTVVVSVSVFVVDTRFVIWIRNESKSYESMNVKTF